MEKHEVKVGATYVAKVSDKLTQVRIDGENPHGGWDATNLATKKKVRIKSAQRLRGRAPAATGAGDDAPAAQAGPAATRANVGREGASPAKTKVPREKRMGCLDAAVRVLKEIGKPMRCKGIIEVALKKGYWQTKGATPAATLYSAVVREVAKRGKAGRFRRADVKETKDGKAVALRGYFDLTEAARKEA